MIVAFEGTNYTVDNTYKATTIELMDLAVDLRNIDLMLELLQSISDDDLGCSGNCQGVAGYKNPHLNQIKESLKNLRFVVVGEIDRSLK